jgi:hypothetical protein
MTSARLSPYSRGIDEWSTVLRKAQVFLREDQKAALQRLSRRTGRKQSELIRHGVDLAIAEAETRSSQQVEVKTPSGDWKQAWLSAAGVWADRDDLDELYADMRRNNANRADELERHWRGK